MKYLKGTLRRVRSWKTRRTNYRLIASSELFDRKWYLRENPDVRVQGADPVRHYLDVGWKEGRNPGPDFNTVWYLAVNKDVARAKVNPLIHFILNGRAEYRSQKPPKPMLET